MVFEFLGIVFKISGGSRQRDLAIPFNPTRLCFGQYLAYRAADQIVGPESGQPLKGGVDREEAIVHRFAGGVTNNFVESKAFGHPIEKQPVLPLAVLQLLFDDGVDGLGARHRFQQQVDADRQLREIVVALDPHMSAIILVFADGLYVAVELADPAQQQAFQTPQQAHYEHSTYTRQTGQQRPNLAAAFFQNFAGILHAG